jgi:hypothetical protein
VNETASFAPVVPPGTRSASSTPSIATVTEWVLLGIAGVVVGAVIGVLVRRARPRPPPPYAGAGESTGDLPESRPPYPEEVP